MAYWTPYDTLITDCVQDLQNVIDYHPLGYPPSPGLLAAGGTNRYLLESPIKVTFSKNRLSDQYRSTG
jgi:hypothetical protein